MCGGAGVTSEPDPIFRIVTVLMPCCYRRLQVRVAGMYCMLNQGKVLFRR
jgi:hypothetical protein